MIDLLPPVGGGDLATKRNLDGLRIELQRHERLEGRIDRLDGKMEHGFGRMQKSTYLSMLASNVTVVSLVFAVLRAA